MSIGNVVLLKPSDVSTHTSNLMMELIPQYLDPVSITYSHIVQEEEKNRNFKLD